MTGGRAAWNVVTSLNDGEAQNMGRDEVLEHDLRYDRADEFMEVVLGHWDSWEDGAIVRTRRPAASPTRTRSTGSTTRASSSGRAGRSPCRARRRATRSSSRPGQSGRGKRFGAQWGELIFAVYPSIEAGKRDYAEFKAEAARRPRSRARQDLQLVNPVPPPPRRRPRTNGR